MEKKIRQTWFFNQSQEEVWDYLTKPELIEQWLMKSNMKPVVGHKFQFTFVAKKESKYEGVVNCEVLEVDPFNKLSYSWQGSMQDKSREFDSTVIWTLSPKDNGTELLLQHDGFEVMEDILNHTSGWNACLKRFEDQINTVKS